MFDPLNSYEKDTGNLLNIAEGIIDLTAAVRTSRKGSTVDVCSCTSLAH